MNLVYLIICFFLSSCIKWEDINPVRTSKATTSALGASGDSRSAKDCVGAFPNSSVGAFDIKTSFPFEPDCSYIFQYPDQDVAIGVLETLGREQIIWFRFKTGLPEDGTYAIKEGFALDGNLAASLDHAELNLYKEYPNGDPIQGEISLRRHEDQVYVTFEMSTTVPLKSAQVLKMSGEIIVPNTIESLANFSHN